MSILGYRTFVVTFPGSPARPSEHQQEPAAPTNERLLRTAGNNPLPGTGHESLDSVVSGSGDRGSCRANWFPFFKSARERETDVFATIVAGLQRVDFSPEEGVGSRPARPFLAWQNFPPGFAGRACHRARLPWEPDRSVRPFQILSCDLTVQLLPLPCGEAGPGLPHGAPRLGGDILQAPAHS